MLSSTDDIMGGYEGGHPLQLFSCFFVGGFFLVSEKEASLFVFAHSASAISCLVVSS
jgi:hypothetical protein